MESNEIYQLRININFIWNIKKLLFLTFKV